MADLTTLTDVELDAVIASAASGATLEAAKNEKQRRRIESLKSQFAEYASDRGFADFTVTETATGLILSNVEEEPNEL
jgi:hypothetical protein